MSHLHLKSVLTMIVAGLTIFLMAGLTTTRANADDNENAQATIARQVAHMSLSQKVGQLYVGENASAYDVRHYHLGGIIVSNNRMYKSTLSRLQRAGHHSLLIGTDQEGGAVSRLGINNRLYPSPHTAYERGGLAQIRKTANYMAYRLHKIGINWNYAPDADLATPGSYMYFRALGRGPKKTGQYVAIFVKAMQNHGIAATLKHFPGYGSESGDTDFTPVYTNRSLSHLKHYDFVPFKAGINAGADSVMVTNIVLNKINKHVPATLSRKDINLLRNGLGFNGVIVTDSLSARAVQHYCDVHDLSADYEAVKAGNDMIMASDYAHEIPYLVRDIKRGWISRRLINADVTRILTMKYKLGLRY